MSKMLIFLVIFDLNFVVFYVMLFNLNVDMKSYQNDCIFVSGFATSVICQYAYTGGTVRAKKLSLKSLALSGLFGAKCSLPQKSFS